MVKLVPLTAAELLPTPEAQANFLTDAWATGERDVIVNALAIITRLKGVNRTAREGSLSRSGVKKAISKEGNPRLSSLVDLLEQAGLHPVFQPEQIQPDAHP